MSYSEIALNEHCAVNDAEENQEQERKYQGELH